MRAGHAICILRIAATLLVSCGDDPLPLSDERNFHTPDELTPLACADGSPGLGLSMLPAGPVTSFLYKIRPACESLPGSQILVRNTTERAIGIRHVGVMSDTFVATAAGVPRDLLPGESLPIQLSFRSAEPGEWNTNLAIEGPAGCQSFPIYGRAIQSETEGLVAYTPYAVDFGPVPASSVAPSQRIEVLVQRGRDLRGAMLAGFAAEPEAFTLGASTRLADDGACIRAQVDVSFSAPAKLGEVRGTLSWTLKSNVDGVGYEGFQLVDLIGTSVRL